MEFEIRPVRLSDAEGINALRRMPGVFENILGIPSERAKRNEEHLANLDGNAHQFVAVVRQGGGELLIGAVSLSVEANPRRRHCAGLGIMVHRDYQGEGVGKALMGAALDVADNWLMLSRVELTVFVDNVRAIALYEKLGFEIEGTIRKGSIRNGALVDEYMMARLGGGAE